MNLEPIIFQEHVINLRQGKFSQDGICQSSEVDVDKLIQQHLKNALNFAKKEGRPLRLLIWAHGGLVKESEALNHIETYGPLWKMNGIYPLYFVWETGLLETVEDHVPKWLGGKRSMITDRLLESTLQLVGRPAWDSMKGSAWKSSKEDGGARYFANALAEFYHEFKDDVEIHVCGHSAGSIFHSFFIPLLAKKEVTVKTLFLLAPACTVALFKSHLFPLIQAGDIQKCAMFTMKDIAEQADNVIKIYRKSLLYFVANACEHNPPEPILGMEKYLQQDSAMARAWGLSKADAAVRGCELILTPNDFKGPLASNSTSHGGFDNDAATLNSMVLRINGITRFVGSAPFTDEKKRGNRSVNATSNTLLTDALTDQPVTIKTHIQLICTSIATDDPKIFIGAKNDITYRVAGHYHGVDPAYSEKYLDCWVSGIPPFKIGSTQDEYRSHAAEYEAHGIALKLSREERMSGQLGHCTAIPKKPDGKDSNHNQYALFLGLGEFGKLGRIELTFAVASLCEYVHSVGGTHIIAVLIGSGNGNLPYRETIRAWMNGIASVEANKENLSIKKITFVEYSPLRSLEIDSYFSSPGQAFTLSNYTEPGNLKILQKQAAASNTKEFEKKLTIIQNAKLKKVSDPNVQQDSFQQTHITCRFQENNYIFTALTSNASVPMRIINTDPVLIDEICQNLINAEDNESLYLWGTTLREMLVPRDMYDLLFNSKAHVNLELDATTARIPWELLALRGTKNTKNFAERFLGTAKDRGVTRKLSTSFAPATYKNKPRSNGCNVLIIADPATDASLYGADKEGTFVHEIIQKQAKSDVMSTLLTRDGATRSAVSRELCNGVNYDVLHFAGHCFYDPNSMAKSGWLFQADPLTVLSANELQRFPYVPELILSNACESGVTHIRKTVQDHLSIPASFAEAFFAQGVKNFISTGWPVDDEAALKFSEELYKSLLGGSTISEALYLARKAAAKISILTAGAYQHYGNSSHRLIYDDETALAPQQDLINRGRRSAPTRNKPQ